VFEIGSRGLVHIGIVGKVAQTCERGKGTLLGHERYSVGCDVPYDDGGVHCDKKEFSIAVAELPQDLEELVLIDSRARCLGRMSDVEFYHRNCLTATELCMRAKDLFSEAGDRHGELRALHELVLIVLQEKDMRLTKIHIAEAKRVCEEVGCTSERAGLGKYIDSRGCWVDPPSDPRLTRIMRGRGLTPNGEGLAMGLCRLASTRSGPHRWSRSSFLSYVETFIVQL
jgi:hypothetical protein